MIDGSPQVMPFSANFDEDLVQVPLPLWRLSDSFRPTFANLVREVSTEPVDPVADRFVSDVDPSLVKQVFDIAQ